MRRVPLGSQKGLKRGPHSGPSDHRCLKEGSNLKASLGDDVAAHHLKINHEMKTADSSAHGRYQYPD